MKSEFFAVSAALVVFILLFFSPTLIQGKVPLSSSYLYKMYPWRYYASGVTPGQVSNNILSDEYDSHIPSMQYFLTQFRQGHYPLWNPYAGSGEPYGLIFYKDNFTLDRLSTIVAGIQWGTILYMVLKLYLVGIFSYFYLRYRDFNWVSALAGSIVLMLSTSMIVNGMRHTVDSVVYAPGILYFAERFVHEKRYRHFVALVFLVGVTMISGFPSVTLYTLLLIVIYLAYRNLVELRNQPIQQRIQNLLWLYLGFGVGILWVAFTLVPTYEYLRYIDLSYRDGRGPTIMQWQLIGRLLNPNICGSPLAENWYCSSNYNETAIYVGLLPLMLIPFSLANKRNRWTSVFFLASALLVLMTVFGVASLNRIVGSLPLFKINPNTRMIALLPICFAFITATGMESLTLVPRNRFWSLLYFLGLAAVVLYLFKVIPGPAPMPENAPYLQNQELTTLILLGLFSLVLTVVFFRKLLQLAFPALIALCILERIVLLQGYQGASYPNAFYPETPTTTFLESNMSPDQRMLGIGRDFAPSTPLYYSINSFVGHALADTRFKQIIDLINPNAYPGYTTQPILTSTSLDLNSPLLDLYRVRYIATRPTDEPLWWETLAGQREFNQTYALDQMVSFGQSFTVARGGVAELLAVRIDAPDARPLAAGLQIFSGKQTLVQFHGQLTKRDNGWYAIELPNLPLEKGQDLWFQLTPDQASLPPGAVLSTVNYDIYKGGVLLIDGEAVSGDSTFALLQSNPAMANRFKLVHSGDMNIYENEDVNSRIPVVHKLRYANAESCASTLSQIDPFDEAVVDEPGISLKPVNAKSIARIDGMGADQIAIDAQIQGVPSLVVLSDFYYPGWEATVDGVPTKIYRANCIMRGVIVPPGHHVIRMSYRPLSFKIGAGISGVPLVFLIAAGLAIRARRRHEPEDRH